ncbi:MAG: hypothetical protein GOU98_02935 [Candidatus Altiarchaeota archaeon]|nr:hypothetical protein [Candidatus Altiarchaeota archaeon]
MRWGIVLMLIMASTSALTLEYDQVYTAPAQLETTGFVYLTFCSNTGTLRAFSFTAGGIPVSPNDISIDFDGTALIPDCKQAVVQVSSNTPGLYSLLVTSVGDEWIVPVEFSKEEPISITTSRAVIYTGYDSVNIKVSGLGEDASLKIWSPVVGISKIQASNLPASFPTTFYFSKTGFYEVPVTLEYTINDKIITRNFTLGLRVEDAPLRILNDLRVPSDGIANFSVELEVPETIYASTVSLSSECLEGGTSKRIENFKTGTVTFYIKGTCDPGLYSLDVSVGDLKTSVPLTVYGPEGFEQFTNTFVKDGKHTLEVILANEGSQAMKAVSVRILPGEYSIIKEGSFVGDLDFGDFDSAELVFVPFNEQTTVNYQLTYTLGGEKLSIQKTYDYRYKKSTNTVGIISILVVIGLGVYYVRRSKARR